MTDPIPRPESEAAASNVRRLLEACHRPEPADPALVRRVEERLIAESAALRKAPPRAHGVGAAPNVRRWRLGLAVAAGIVLVVAGATAFRPDASDQSSDVAGVRNDPTGVSDSVTEPAAGDLASFLRLTAGEQALFVARRRADAIAAGDVVALEALHSLLSDPRAKDVSIAGAARADVAHDALRIDERLDWAHRSLGRRNVRDLLDALRRDCPAAFTVPGADEDEADRLLESARTAPWADATAFANADALAARVRARNAAIVSDPRALPALASASWLRENPLFRDHRYELRFADPYVICQQYAAFGDGESHKNPERIAKAKALADRDAILLTESHRRFRELFAEPLALPDLGAAGRTLFAIVAWNRESWVAMLRGSDTGADVPPWARAFYCPGDQRIFHYVGDASMRAQDELPVAGGRVQKASDQELFRTGALQLLHEYGALVRGETLAPGRAPPMDTAHAWLYEGVSEFMAAVEVDADANETLAGARFVHNRLRGERIMQVVGDGRTANLRDDAKLWTLSEILATGGQRDLFWRGAKLEPRNALEMRDLYAARAWGFVHFAWNYDGGVHRPALLAAIRGELEGRGGADAVARCFGRPGANDWGRVEDEFEWYWDRVLARRFGWRGPGRTRPWDTVTDAPEGRYVPE